jgi:hypothetical protein
MWERMSQLSQQIAQAKASNLQDLAAKASVVLDWLDTDNGDIAEELAASLCRDILHISGVTDDTPKEHECGGD